MVEMPDFLDNKYTTSKMVMVIRARARISDPLAAIILFVILEGVKNRYGVGEIESLNHKSKAKSQVTCTFSLLGFIGILNSLHCATLSGFAWLFISVPRLLQ
jgi:hypothetical protein